MVKKFNVLDRANHKPQKDPRSNFDCALSCSHKTLMPWVADLKPTDIQMMAVAQWKAEVFDHWLEAAIGRWPLVMSHGEALPPPVEGCRPFHDMISGHDINKLGRQVVTNIRYRIGRPFIYILWRVLPRFSWELKPGDPPITVTCEYGGAAVTEKVYLAWRKAHGYTNG